MSSVHEYRVRRSRFARRGRPPAAFAKAAARSAVARVTEWIRQEYEFRRTTAALRELDDRLLADVGLTRIFVDHGMGRREVIIELDHSVRR